MCAVQLCWLFFLFNSTVDTSQSKWICCRSVRRIMSVLISPNHMSWPPLFDTRRAPVNLSMCSFSVQTRSTKNVQSIDTTINHAILFSFRYIRSHHVVHILRPSRECFVSRSVKDVCHLVFSPPRKLWWRLGSAARALFTFYITVSSSSLLTRCLDCCSLMDGHDKWFTHRWYGLFSLFSLITFPTHSTSCFSVRHVSHSVLM